MVQRLRLGRISNGTTQANQAQGAPIAQRGPFLSIWLQALAAVAAGSVLAVVLGAVTLLPKGVLIPTDSALPLTSVCI